MSHKKGAQALIWRMYKFYLLPKTQETLIGYLTARSTKNLIIAGNIETTRDWWQNRRNDFVLYISQVVLDEVAKGDIEIALKRLEILNELPLVELNQAVRDLSAQFLRRSNLPTLASDDAERNCGSDCPRPRLLINMEL